MAHTHACTHTHTLMCNTGLRGGGGGGGYRQPAHPTFEPCTLKQATSKSQYSTGTEKRLCCTCIMEDQKMPALKWNSYVVAVVAAAAQYVPCFAACMTKIVT